MTVLRQLSRPSIVAVAEAVERGGSVRELVPADLTVAVEAELRRLSAAGLTPAHLAWTLRQIAEERLASEALSDRCELVWSSDDGPGRGTRSNANVVRDLFTEARHDVLIATYALDAGEKARALFGALAERMEAEPELTVRVFANVARQFQDARTESQLLDEFARRFRDDIWPGTRLPAVFYDPRSLKSGPLRACLHAKCVVIDSETAFVTSANFTEAAHDRNIEAGVLVRDPAFARSLVSQFERLLAQRRLVALGL